MNNNITNNMKKITIAILTFAAVLLGSSDAFAQGKWGADSAECIKYMSYYKEYYKQKAYDESLPSWRQAYKLCPATASQNMLIDGTSLMRRLINKNANNAEYKAALVDTLLTLHDLRAQYYPKYKETALNNKGLDLANFVKNDPQKLYTGYEEIIANNQENTKVQILLFDLQAAIDLYQSGSLGAEDVIQIYQRNSEIVDKVPAKSDVEAEQNANVKSDLGSLFASSKVASCDNLIELFTPRIEADPNNLELANNIVATMSLTDDCTDNDLYLRAVTVMNDLNPSANSAYYLFKLHSARGNVDEAISYMNDAISREDSDPSTDAAWNYELATFCFKSGQNVKAVEAANYVADNSEELKGKAYFLLGNIWGSLTCSGNEIEARSKYWVACDYMRRAIAADPTLEEEANRYISQYSVYFPEAADAFMYNVEAGQSYTVSCGGLRATTTVRVQR